MHFIVTRRRGFQNVTIMRNHLKVISTLIQLIILVGATSWILSACNTTSGYGSAPPNIPSLPVIEVASRPTTLYQDYSASLEGTKDIEIRPQVEGYLEKIYVDEGAHVRKGQQLFKVNDRVYVAQLNNAQAALSAARANKLNAEINVNRLTPLVENNVVSEVQLKTAKASYDAAVASVAQAEAMVNTAKTNLDYTLIIAPADGYIGRIPLKTGSLVGLNTSEPLTILSEINEVYAYFSLSENDFLLFKNEYRGNSMEEKIKNLPPVQLVLADNSVYDKQGKVQMMSGQFNHTTGAISLRAVFPNESGLLRSGNTGKVRLPRAFASALLVPQEATFELQDKVFVFVLADSNKVNSVPITISGRSGNFYIVDKGIKPGDHIVYSGLDRLHEGVIIHPEKISMDSLLNAKPL